MQSNRQESTSSSEDEIVKAINMQFLQIFYLTPYVEADFYQEFEKRMSQMKN